jgi:cell division protein FtsB
MNEFVTGSFLVVSEVALLFAAALTSIVYMVTKKLRGNKKQAKDFVETLKKSEAQRKEKRSQLLKERFGLDDESIEQYVERVVEREKSLYTRFLDIFLGRGKGQLADLKEQVEALIESCYIQGQASKQETESTDDTLDELEPTDSGEAIKELMDENHALKKENERLTAENNDLNKELERIMSEYVSIYGRDQSKDEN